MKNADESIRDDQASPVSAISPTNRGYLERLNDLYHEEMLNYIRHKLGKMMLSEISPEDLWQNVIVSWATYPFELTSPNAERTFVKKTVSHHIAKEIERARAKKRGGNWKKLELIGGMNSIPRHIQQDERVSNKKERRRSGPTVKVSKEPDPHTALSSVRKRMHPSRKSPLDTLVEEEAYIGLLQRLPKTRMRKAVRLLGRGMSIEEIAAHLNLENEKVKAEKAKMQSELKSRGTRQRRPKTSAASAEGA